MRYKATVQYDGSDFYGWQIQPHTRTVQEEINKALTSVNKKESMIHGSGRTDTSVHAMHQVFHFDSDLDLEGSIWLRALNGNLPNDIRILKVEKVENDFHARYNAKSKTYHYKLNTGIYDMFKHRYVYQYNKDLDVNKLKEISQSFEGTHDFTSFNATPQSVIEDQVRTVASFKVKQIDNTIQFEIKGDGFLRHMVRMLVASCIAYAEGKLSKEEIEKALLKPSKDKIKYNVPGCGLYLMHVEY